MHCSAHREVVLSRARALPPVPNEHQRPASREDRELAAIPAPTHAERCRTLVATARAATLCTVARDPAGHPYGSLVTVAIDALGRPLFLLSTLAEHTGNLVAPGGGVRPPHRAARRAQSAARGGARHDLGPCAQVPADERATVRETFLAHQPTASYYVDFSDFAFYRLEPAALRYVGGFGRMSWVSVEDYRAAEPGSARDLSADTWRI